MSSKVAPLPARSAPRKAKAAGIVSSSHLVSAKSVELSELEFGLIVAWNAFSRWAVRCMAAAGCPELTITDVLVLHHICHRARNKKVGDICFVLNVEDTHVVGYSLKKLLAAGLAQGDRVGKEVFYSPTPAGETAVAKYREVREACLIANLDAERNADIGESARLLRTMSGLYDQAARAATSLVSASLGVVMLETRFPRPPRRHRQSADVRVSGPLPHRARRVAAPRRRRARPGAARAVHRRGARARSAKASPRSTTSCGFLALFQREMAAAVAVPVWTSSLLLVAEIEARLARRPPRRRRHRRRRVARRAEHLRAVGARDRHADRRARARLARFARPLLDDRAELDVDEAERATVAAAERLVARHPEVAAIVLECTNMPPYADAVRAATGLPVHDITTLVRARLAAAASEAGRHERAPAPPLAVLDRSRRHLHRHRRQASRRHAGDAEAALRQPRAVPRRRGRRDPPPARRRAGRADHRGARSSR